MGHFTVPMATTTTGEDVYKSDPFVVNYEQ